MTVVFKGDLPALLQFSVLLKTTPRLEGVNVPVDRSFQLQEKSLSLVRRSRRTCLRTCLSNSPSGLMFIMKIGQIKRICDKIQLARLLNRS